MITRERLWFFLLTLGLSADAANYSDLLRGLTWRAAVPVIAGLVLASALLTALFSVWPRIACYVSSAVFGGAGVLIFLRGFSESLSHTMGGIAMLGGAAFLFLWTGLRRALDLG